MSIDDSSLDGRDTGEVYARMAVCRARQDRRTLWDGGSTDGHVGDKWPSAPPVLSWRRNRLAQKYPDGEQATGAARP